ncbi:MAG: spore cortex biosynthesis protein YabQ, partial [Pseudoflavonifractor sp.]
MGGELAVLTQARAFAAAVLLGAGLGLGYDLLHVLRLRIPLRPLAALLDFFFWVGVTASVFLFSLGLGGGRVRGVYLLAIFLGGSAYFLLLSLQMRRLGYRLADFIALVLRILLLPLTGICALCRKFKEFAKKHFLYGRKWYKLWGIPGETNASAKGTHSEGGGGTGHEDQKSGTADEAGGSDPA